MNLVPVRGHPGSTRFLYDLFLERSKSSWISTEEVPSWEDHQEFVEWHPFLHWYVIEVEGTLIGAIEVTDRNEIGVSLLKAHQGKGHAGLALGLFLKSHQPLPPVPAVRNGHWLANIAPGNKESKAFFGAFGFRPIQETWAL